MLVGLAHRLLFLSALAAAEEIIYQDSSRGGKQKILENTLKKRADDQVQYHTAGAVVLPSQVRPSPSRQTSAVSSLATTPFASTLGSRSTSQSSETDSLPITPANELPTTLNGSNTQQIVGSHISTSRVSSVPHGISATENAEAPLSQMEELVDLYLLSHHTAHDAASSTDPGDELFSDEFLKELFEEGDAARRLVELQRRSPEGGKSSFRS